jgi:pimeloyl-[acyl-carrier protein] methyl ester esterase
MSRLHIETVGQGPDLVLLHGWGMHGGVWSPVVPQLAQSFRLHIVDLPGLGLSEPCDPYTLDALVGRVAEAVPNNVTMCGWSLGGLLAMRWAKLLPQQVRQLVLVGATPRFVSGEGWNNGIDPEVFRQFAAQVGADYRGTLSRFLALQAHGGDAAKDTIRQLRERFFERPGGSPQTLQAGLDLLLESDLRQEVAQLNMPTLVLHGDYDKLAPVAAAQWMAEQGPQGVRVEICKGASHAPFLSHPGWFVDQLKDWLGD